ncbi:hypothetical protein THICB1_100336 [Thiomonas arsenitoxydans]|uniref:Transposase n=1 Tax=Thiomonas arsenitoxydans (strain DSM 22701 / CIP 110005 / 3As) TaxID=426114 RepID=A0ABP1YXV5_THIA3|nr:hypothetical protein THICB1_100336 [Thiomonas arsenitoxydans]
MVPYTFLESLFMSNLRNARRRKGVKITKSNPKSQNNPSRLIRPAIYAGHR